MTTTYKINSGLPTSTKIEAINDFCIALEGLVTKGQFDLNELNQIFTDLGQFSRKWSRNNSLGHTTSNYTSWSHIKAEAGYSIWKYTPTSYSYNSLNCLYFDSKLVTNAGQASSESLTTFDKVFFYDGTGATYTDDTTEAGTESGTEFTIHDAINDYIYLGLSTTFGGAAFKWQTRGSGYALKIEYYNASSGSGWVQLTSTTNTLVDNTSSFESDGTITWTIPGDWATNSVNSTTKYWVRISTTTVPVTTAKAYSITPANSVPSLLALSSDQIFKEQWAWCTYGSSIYVTIRNTGKSTYEGSYFISSSSSASNLQNFFVYNHEYTADYLLSTYSANNMPVVVYRSISASTATGSGYVTLKSFTLSANTLSTNRGIKIKAGIRISTTSSGSSGSGAFRLSYGGNTVCTTSSNAATNFILEAWLVGAGTTSTQRGYIQSPAVYATGTASVDSTSAQTVTLAVDLSSDTDVWTCDFIEVEYI